MTGPRDPNRRPSSLGLAVRAEATLRPRHAGPQPESMAGAGLAMVHAASLFNALLVPLAWVIFLMVWLVSHSVNMLILISPFLKVNERLRQLLEDNDRDKIDIRVVYGKNELQPDENNWLKSKASVRSSFCKNLHAKCFLNESEALITSMNLYEFSQVNNEETGVLVSKVEDPAMYAAVYEESMRLIRISEEVRVTVEKVVPADRRRTRRPAALHPRQGLCGGFVGPISCKIRIPYSHTRPPIFPHQVHTAQMPI